MIRSWGQNDPSMRVREGGRRNKTTQCKQEYGQNDLIPIYGVVLQVLERI